jgi:hypothetical protein
MRSSGPGNIVGRVWPRPEQPARPLNAIVSPHEEMSATYYDPDRAPNPREWLALDEHERIRLAQNFHIGARIKLRDTKAHALYHAIVENQIAEGFGPTCRAVERLQKGGLTRHDAVHAVGSAIAEATYESMQGARTVSGEEAQRQLNARIDALTAAEWRGKRES